ncbi:hypothetical protein AMK31_37055 [Streptomyces sp. TSRI0107]|nr:hypothetical protein AMK31_37055 [Streptomyces sp. TSRI0107]
MTGMIAALALVPAALFPQESIGWLAGDDSKQAGAPTAAETERPTKALSAEPTLRPTLAEPLQSRSRGRAAAGSRFCPAADPIRIRA